MKFEYSAKNSANQIVKGTVEAVDREAASNVISKQSLKLLSLKEMKTGGFSLNMEIGEPKVKLQDRVIFTRQLATMVNAGVPLVRSLATLTEQTESKGLKKYLPQITKKVESGITLADALSDYPKVFNDVYVNMVAAGEEGGILDDILDRLAAQQEKDAEIRGKLKSAMTYPAVILSITFVAFIFLMTTMVPKIGRIITDLAGEDYVLPGYTRVMLGISDFLVNYGLMMAPVIFVGGFILLKFFRTPKGRPILHRILVRIPLVNKIIIKVALARFARTFSSLNAAGVGIVDSLHVTANAVGNEVIKEKLLDATEQVKNGKPLSAPLMESKIFPPILSQMIAVGEETGEIDQILEKLAGFYEEEVDQVAGALTSILEPLMIVILGGIIGVIALSVFGPISSVTESIG